MKAVKEGKFPNLKRIVLHRCSLHDCEWPEVPEFYCDIRSVLSDTFRMQKMLLNLTKLTVREHAKKPLHIDGPFLYSFRKPFSSETEITRSY